MNTSIKVARYHLAQPLSYVGGPWVILALNLAVALVIFGMIPPRNGHTGALLSIYVVFLALGVLSMVRSLPFALALGMSRRSYYLGTVLQAVALAAVDGLALALLQWAERATDGWGEGLHFFRVVWILAGPWSLTWLTSFVGLVLFYVYGMWFGLVFRRWDLAGLLAFIAAQAVALMVGLLVATRLDAWPGIGRFFAGLTALGLTGALAALAAVLLAGGYATIRRVSV
jgi:hypothetical protein